MGVRAAFNLGPTSIDIDPCHSRRTQSGRSGTQRVSRSLRWLDSQSDLRCAGNDNEVKPDAAVSFATYLTTSQNSPATQMKPKVKSTVLR